MKVLKFGGTSIGDANQIRKVVKLISQNNSKIVVLSALSGITNLLSEFIKQVNNENYIVSDQIKIIIKERHLALCTELLNCTNFIKLAQKKITETLDALSLFNNQKISGNNVQFVLAQGELLSATIIHLYALEQETDAVYIPALNFMRLNEYNEPDYECIRTNLTNEINKYSNCNLIITNGFICLNQKGHIDNLGRGGSDFTATIIGNVLNSTAVEIWTDIDGLHNNDPRFVEHTKTIQNLSFDEAKELAYFGAKVLHPSSISPAQNRNIPIIIKNSFSVEDLGTVISEFTDNKKLKAIAAKDDIITIMVKSGRMMQAYGFLRRIFEVFEKYQTSVDMLTTSEISVAMTIDNNTHLNPIIEELSKLGETQVVENQCIISIVGDYTLNQNISIQKIIDGLGNIPVKMISFGASKINMSFVIDSENKTEALNLLNSCILSDELCLADK
jgi:aspartate kinase